MRLLINILPYIEIILSVVLVLGILLQQTSASIGGALGGTDGGGFYHTRRGFEKFLFILSIVCAILLVISAFLTKVLQS